MARKRMIDPTIWADEDFGSLSSDAKVLYIGIISNADDEGRLPGNALFLSSTIFPYEPMTKDKATKIRDEVLGKMGSLKLYVENEKEYLQFEKWTQYQAINRPTQSKYPPLTEDSLKTHGGLTPNRIEKNRIEKNRNSKNSLIPCTEEEIRGIAVSLEVSLDVVQDTHAIILNKIAAGEFKGKTIYHSLENWIRMGITRGTIKKKTSSIPRGYKLYEKSK